jgi:hypothetical protein
MTTTIHLYCIYSYLHGTEKYIIIITHITMIITYNILSAVHLMPRKVQIHSTAGSKVHFFNHYLYVKI